jgi:hypothetical protein
MPMLNALLSKERVVFPAVHISSGVKSFISCPRRRQSVDIIVVSAARASGFALDVVTMSDPSRHPFGNNGRRGVTRDITLHAPHRRHMIEK